MAEKKKEPTGVREIAELEVIAKGRRRVGMERVQHLLCRFGYLEEGEYTHDEVDEQTSASLAKYQEHHALPVTGAFDEPTREMMTRSRCGLPDVRLGIDFTTLCAWNKRNLTFAF